MLAIARFAPLRPATPKTFRRLLVCWVERARQRRALAELARERLEDLGLTPEQARGEAAKPFWRR